MPLSAFAGDSGAALINVANQQARRGACASFTRAASAHLECVRRLFFRPRPAVFLRRAYESVATFRQRLFPDRRVQIDADLSTGTHVQTVFRFSPGATVFAIDPFAGRLAVYRSRLEHSGDAGFADFRSARARRGGLDARNLLDMQVEQKTAKR